MSKVGTTDIKGIMLGSTEIVKAYLGTNVVYEKSNPLPYDSKVEYLECDGGQYVSNVYKETSIKKLVFGVQFNGRGDILGNITSSSTYQNGAKILGVSGSGNSAQAFLYYKPTGTRILLQHACAEGTRHAVSGIFNDATRKFVLWVDSDSGTTAGTYSKLYSSNFYSLLCRHPSMTGFKGKIYSISIKENDVTVKSFIPVRVGQVGYFYEEIGGQLYSNSGTGNFTLGADKN